MRNYSILFTLTLTLFCAGFCLTLENVNRSHLIVKNVRKIFDFTDEIVEKIVEILDSIKSEENELCIEQTQEAFYAFNRTEEWALKMFDSWGKVPPGVLVGNTIELGQFDECLGIRKEFDSSAGLGLIKGQYCLPVITDIPSEIKDEQIPSMRIPTPSDTEVNLRIGVCVPAACSVPEIRRLFSELLNITKSQFLLTDALCSTDDEVKFSGWDIFALTFFGIVILCLILSTVYDWYTTTFEKNKTPLFITFSIITNSRNLFKMKKINSNDVMECLNGIRCLSITWVVISHAYLHFAYMPLINTFYAKTWITYLHSMIFINGQYAVDSFFMMSGLLVTWSVLKQLDKTGKLNVPLMYFHRYIRLTPVLAAAVLYAATLIKYSGSGPIWKSTLQAAALICEKNWWSTLLYVQNYVHPGQMCLGHSWYLAVDMQLYILSPLVLIPLWKWRRRFIPVIFLAILLSTASIFVLYMVNGFSISILTDLLSLDKKQRLTYYATHSRVGEWLVGVLLGYYLYVNKRKTIKTPWYIVTAGWTVSLGIIGAIIFGSYGAQQIESPPTQLESAFFESCSRIAWAMALSWIVFACTRGYGGVVNSFLSLPFWQPFSRLSYSIYITHLIIQFLAIATTRTSKNFSDFEAIRKFWGDFGLTITLSTLTVLAFESPIVGLEKLIFTTKTNNTSESLQKICSTETLQIESGNVCHNPKENT